MQQVCTYPDCFLINWLRGPILVILRGCLTRLMLNLVKKEDTEVGDKQCGNCNFDLLKNSTVLQRLGPMSIVNCCLVDIDIVSAADNVFADFMLELLIQA